ncbi:ExbD/TolR family protein [Jannaschia marina]|uniref:ExbD/TolR family protein n=1 Tax=Jannaschia marina TaxID=2741674 RepID=UPI0015C91FE5|nr:biopolymer transporter ExbD [Jannaschia marina]
MARAPLLPPAEPRRYRFALTPLADAMFQLLIFFMLASSQVPYSILSLTPGAGPGQGGHEATAQPTGGEPTALWSIDAGAVVAGGQRFGFDALPDLAAALAGSDAPGVVLLTGERARVQDLVAVTEALTAAGVPRISMARAGGRP